MLSSTRGLFRSLFDSASSLRHSSLTGSHRLATLSPMFISRPCSCVRPHALHLPPCYCLMSSAVYIPVNLPTRRGRRPATGNSGRAPGLGRGRREAVPGIVVKRSCLHARNPTIEPCRPQIFLTIFVSELLRLVFSCPEHTYALSNRKGRAPNLGVTQHHVYIIRHKQCPPIASSICGAKRRGAWHDLL